MCFTSIDLRLGKTAAGRQPFFLKTSDQPVEWNRVNHSTLLYPSGTHQVYYARILEARWLQCSSKPSANLTARLRQAKMPSQSWLSPLCHREDKPTYVNTSSSWLDLIITLFTNPSGLTLMNLSTRHWRQKMPHLYTGRAEILTSTDCHPLDSSVFQFCVTFSVSPVQNRLVVWYPPSQRDQHRGALCVAAACSWWPSEPPHVMCLTLVFIAYHVVKVGWGEKRGRKYIQMFHFKCSGQMRCPA